MKYMKLFVFLMLSVFILGACGVTVIEEVIDDIEKIPENLNNEIVDIEEFDDIELSAGLVEFKNRLDALELAIEELETEFDEINSEGETREIVRFEGQILSEQLRTVDYDLRQYMHKNFEQHCLDDGGTLELVEENDSHSCSFTPSPIPSPAGEIRDDISNRVFSLSARLIIIQYTFFGTSLVDFENRLDELEIIISELEIDLNERFAYIEANDDELWQQIRYHMGRPAVLGDIVSKAHELQKYLAGVAQGITNYTLANPDLYPEHCASTERWGPDCPQDDLREIRISELRNRLNGIIFPFGTG